MTGCHPGGGLCFEAETYGWIRLRRGGSRGREFLPSGDLPDRSCRVAVAGRTSRAVDSRDRFSWILPDWPADLPGSD